MAVLGKIRKFAGDAGFVFSVNGSKPVAGFNDVKVRIDRRLCELLGAVEHWTIHDIRRSAATHLADSENGLGIAPHVVDKLLNHVSGAITGVARVYNRNEYMPERKAALDAWSDYVARLVGANVVALCAR